jgi:hypothetical protein
MLTLGEVRNSSRVRRIAGSCSGTSDFTDAVNDATRMLANRGNWWGTVKRICACVYCPDQIVWPRQVSEVLAIKRCNRTLPLLNHWAEFSDLDSHDLLSYWGGVGWEWSFGPSSILGGAHHSGVQGNLVSIFNPISSADGVNGVYLRFYPTAQNDVGKTITVFGVDSNGEELRSDRPDGTVQDGIVTTLTLPFATMPASSRNVNTVRHVTRVVKDATDGPLYAYQYRATDNVLLDLARYEASETNPQYQTTRLGGNHLGASGSCPAMVTALVKLRHIDAVYDNDPLAIDNLDAIALMIQAIKNSDAFDPQQSAAMEARAIHEMNLELNTHLPLNQIPVAFSAFGTALPRRAGIGRFV